VSVAILGALLRANLAGSAAILLILALRRPIRLRFGPFAAYLLWLAAPLCVLAGLLPAQASTQVLAPAVTFAATALRPIAPLTRATGFADIIVVVWSAGAMATAALFVRRHMRFVRLLGRLEPLEGSAGVLRGQHLGAGPFVLGSLRPRIVTPSDFETRFSAEARRLVLAHEGVHLARGDAAINGLVTVIQCLAWFNPLAYLAARRLRVDQEIACDAAVISRHPDSRRLYAETLLDAALTPWSAPFGCHWPAAGSHALKERLTMLNLVPASPLRRKLGVALAGLIAAADAGAVWAANPAPPVVLKNPVWAQKPTMAEMVSVYPKTAEKTNVSGKAVIDCRVGRDGRLGACSIRKQDPAQYGFGQAALKLTPRFRMEAKDADGRSTAGAAVTIPILFKLAG
jgi:TonB family protein